MLSHAIESGLPNGRRAAALRALEAALDRVQQAAAEGKPVHALLESAASVADPDDLLQAFLTLMAAQRRALGIVDGPDAQAAFASLQAAYQAGTMPPQQRALYERNGWTAAGWDTLRRAHPNLAGPVPFPADDQRLMAEMDALHPALLAAQAGIVPGAITPQSLAALEAVLEAHRTLLAGAAAGRMRPYLCFAMAGAAAALGRGWQQLNQSRRARDDYAEAARLYEEAGEPDDAAAAGDQASWLGFAVDADVDGGMFSDLSRVTDGIADPLERAQALGRLGRMAEMANDAPGRARYAEAASAALAEAGFPAPDGGADWTDAWVAAACARRSGTGVHKLLQRVGQLALQPLQARHAEACQAQPAEARRLEGVMQTVHDFDQAMLDALRTVQDAISATLMAYTPKLESPPPPAEDPAHAALMTLWRRVGALIDATQADAQPDDTAMAEAACVAAAARESAQPGLAASACLQQARLLERRGQAAASDAAALAGEAALTAGGTAPEELADPTLFSAFLTLRTHRVGLAAAASDSPAVLTLAKGAIGAIEARRDRIHDPYQQGGFLAERTHFYITAAFAAFKLERWDDLLVVMDLYRSRAALRNALAPPPGDGEASLQARLREATAALNAATPEQRPALLAHRRALWRLLSIARLRGAPGRVLPALSLASVQASLAPDEAVVAWVWVADGVLLVLAVDRTRVHAERVILSEQDRTRLRRYVDNVRASAMAEDSLGRTVETLTQALLPPATRAFVAEAKHLVLSPHRALHLVPFHAARVDGRYLIERATIRYVPSFESLLLPWTGSRAGDVIAVGVGAFGRPGVRDLPHAESEARAVAEAWQAAGTRAATLLGDAATRAAFAALPLERCRCLHLATHGSSVLADDTGGDPFLSRLYLRDGEVEALTIAASTLRAELVVMSACCSGQRALGLPGLPELPGDDLFGLQGALFEAGAGSVIGALWPVDDATAGALLPVLHAGLAAGAAPEVALRDATCAYLQGPSAQSVFYWAPLFMTSIGRTGRNAEAVP